MVNIFLAKTEQEIEAARLLFREYEEWLGLDLCFQGFEDELRGLPGKYAQPDGRLFLAKIDTNYAGCIALRKFEDGICEMKRLFIRERFRGIGLGKTLIEKSIAAAKANGYLKMRLDTFPPKMGKAVRLYESHGFRKIAPYYSNPHDDVLFMELAL